MRNTVLVVCLLVSVLSLGAAPPAAADHCSDLLGPLEWICHPDPTLGHSFLTCVESCERVPLPETASGSDLPGAWLVRCQATLPPQVTVPWFEVGPEPGCPDPLEPAPDHVILELLPPNQGGGPALGDAGVYVVTGTCYYSVTATVYGFGANPHENHVPCALVGPLTL